jgi:hypothetical protein
MGCPTTSAAAYENCSGPPAGAFAYPGPPELAAIPNVQTQIGIVAARNKPAGLNWPNWPLSVEVVIRARGITYYKQNPGDCGSGSPVPSGFGSGQIVGLSGQAAGGIVSTLGAAGTLAGPATLGISTAISVAVAGIEDIFAHHAQAVANEQATECAMQNYLNPAIRQIDKAVLSGQITDQQGIAFMNQVGNQAISGLQSIVKPGNLAYGTIGLIKSLMDFAYYYYPIISPIDQFTANRPGQAPSTINPPGSVTDAFGTAPIRSTTDPTFAYAPAIVTAAPPLTPNKVLPSGCTTCSDFLNQGYNQQTGQSAGAADVPPGRGIDWTMIAAIATIILILITVL